MRALSGLSDEDMRLLRKAYRQDYAVSGWLLGITVLTPFIVTLVLPQTDLNDVLGIDELAFAEGMLLGILVTAATLRLECRRKQTRLLKRLIDRDAELVDAMAWRESLPELSSRPR